MHVSGACVKRPLWSQEEALAQRERDILVEYVMGKEKVLELQAELGRRTTKTKTVNAVDDQMISVCF